MLDVEMEKRDMVDKFAFRNAFETIDIFTPDIFNLRYNLWLDVLPNTVW